MILFFPVAFIVIGVGVYGSKIKDLHHKLGWSFGVTIGSAVLGFVAGIAELIVLLKWEMAFFILLEVLNNFCRSLCIWHFRGFFGRKWKMFGWSMALVSTQNHQCLFHLLTFAFVFIFQEYFGTLCTNKTQWITFWILFSPLYLLPAVRRQSVKFWMTVRSYFVT